MHIFPILITISIHPKRNIKCLIQDNNLSCKVPLIFFPRFTLHSAFSLNKSTKKSATCYNSNLFFLIQKQRIKKLSNS